MDQFRKQPWEKYTIDVDFSNVMDSDETMSTTAVSAVDINGNDVSETILDQTYKTVRSITKLAIKVQSGEETASPYIITFRTITSLGNQFEFDLKMIIEEED